MKRISLHTALGLDEVTASDEHAAGCFVGNALSADVSTMVLGFRGDQPTQICK
jgi:hypothetical protein